MKSLFLGVLLISSVGFAKNDCSCEPTTSKNYIGEARQYNMIGFTTHWVCDYECKVNGGEKKLIKGSYKKFYARKQENGLEGICEGMKYVAVYNFQRNSYIYQWDHKVRSISPSKSKSEELQAWAASNDCQ